MFFCEWHSANQELSYPIFRNSVLGGLTIINRQAKSLFKNERVRRLLSEQNCLRAIPTSFVVTYGLPPPPTLHSLIVLLHKFLSQVLKSAIFCARTPFVLHGVARRGLLMLH